jgi:hypothetical protein
MFIAWLYPHLRVYTLSRYGYASRKGCTTQQINSQSGQRPILQHTAGTVRKGIGILPHTVNTEVITY